VRGHRRHAKRSETKKGNYQEKRRKGFIEVEEKKGYLPHPVVRSVEMRKKKKL